MQAFFAAKSEIFFFFSEGAPPKLRAVPAAVKQPLCPLLAAEISRPEHSPPPKGTAPFAPAAAPPLSEKKQKKFSFFVTKRGMGSLTYEPARKVQPMKDLEEFYNAHYSGLYAYCVTLTRNRADAEDLAAETMYRAIRHADKFRGDCKVGTWLCSIARNLFLTQEKKRKRPPPLPEPPEELFSSSDKEDVKEILLSMNALEEPYRGVFLLRTIGGAEYEEIAGIYQKSKSWARVTFHRARLKILEKMEESRHE